MAIVKIVPMPGPGGDGSGGNADIADFVFASNGEESTMTIANHDMMIRTTRTNNQDADISIDSADDVWITANDQVEISSVTDSVAIFTNDFDTKWSFNTDNTLSLPSGIPSVSSNSSIGSGISGNFVIQTMTITAASDAQDSTNDINGSAIVLSINPDTQWFVDNANGTVTITFADNTTAQVDSIYDSTSQQGFPGITFGLAESINKTFEDIFPLTIVGEQVEPNHYVSIRSNEATWKFEGDGDLVTPPDAKIVNSAVPGDITLSAYNGVKLSFADVEGAGLEFPDGTVQTTAYIAPQILPLPDFLTYVNGRSHLPTLNTNFGWDSNGVYFGPTPQGEGEGESYPIFTDFTIPETTPVRVEFDMVVEEFCADAGMAFYVDGTIPQWMFGGSNTTRIAAQFNCVTPELSGVNTFGTQLEGSSPLPEPGTYRVVVSYTPGDGVQFVYGVTNSPEPLGVVTLTESLPTGSYRIGFASDNDANDSEGDAANNRTYIKNLTIILNPETEGEVVYTDTLTNGNSGVSVVAADLVVPTAIKDADGDDFITFTRTSNNTARIATPQDDLSLRSARDITLFPGTDGDGNVYIGWGDATITPNATNRVATIADVNTAPKTHTANNNVDYGTYQANGFVEITTDSSQTHSTEVGSVGGALNSTSFTILVDQPTNDILTAVSSGGAHLRRMTISDSLNFTKTVRNPSPISANPSGYIWRVECDPDLVIVDNTGYAFTIDYNGAPIIWWDAANVNPTSGDFSDGDFRGAKIDYHAYIDDSGTVIGTIYIASDSGDRNVTHIETSSGGSDTGTALFWNRDGNERQLFLYRADGESVLHKIQWTAQMYYASEYYND